MSDTYNGGSYGKYPGLTMIEIRRSFDRCAADPSHRSVAAVLRITREQLESRGRLGMYPVATMVSLMGVLVLGAVWFVLPDSEFKDLALKGLSFPLLGILMFGASTFKSRDVLRLNLRQEHEIRVAAIEALATIWNSPLEIKPLTREQKDTLREILKKEKSAKSIRNSAEPYLTSR